MKKCFECGVVIQKGKCLCSVPRPKPSSSKYNSRDEERAAEQYVSLTVLRRWQAAAIILWLILGANVILIIGGR